MGIHEICRAVSQKLSKIGDKNALNTANFLMITGAFGYVLASLSYVTAILINDKISHKEKRFLIPQEIFDGLINVALFVLLTSKAKKIGEMLILKGKLGNGVITKLVNSDKTKHFFGNIRLFDKGEKYTEAAARIKDYLIKNGTAQDVKSFTKFYNGAGTVTSLIGSVAACNVVTPLVRNKLASAYQKRHLGRIERPIELQSTAISSVAIPRVFIGAFPTLKKI